MPRVVPTLLALAVGAGVSCTLASCGGSEAQLLPGQTAREITANLNTVRQLAAEGDCPGAENAARQVSQQVESLNGVAAQLKSALREGAERLNEVLANCQEPTTEAAPATEPAEPPEKAKKEAKEKKPKEEAPQPPEHELPPQANGKGKGLEKEPPAEPEEGEPAEPSPPSGGVGPGSPAAEGQ